jgi:hypothetical protein
VTTQHFSQKSPYFVVETNTTSEILKGRDEKSENQPYNENTNLELADEYENQWLRMAKK